MKKEELFIVLILVIILGTMSKVYKELFPNFKKNDYSSYSLQEARTTSENANKTVDEDYFDDALFIGDSRTIGIRDYGGLENATYFADVGMNIVDVRSRKIYIQKYGEVTLEKILSENKFGKIYIMLGLNNLDNDVNNDINYNVNKYTELVNYINNKQRDAIIYLEANLHINEKILRNDNINNLKLDMFNYEISKLANEKNILYIDINEYFCREDGQLDFQYTSDGVHVYVRYYKEWANWIKRHTKEELF